MAECSASELCRHRRQKLTLMHLFTDVFDKVIFPHFCLLCIQNEYTIMRKGFWQASTYDKCCNLFVLAEAEAKFGHENLKIYKSKFTPLYHSMTSRKVLCHMKLICLLPTERVRVVIHFRRLFGGVRVSMLSHTYPLYHPLRKI